MILGSIKKGTFSFESSFPVNPNSLLDALIDAAIHCGAVFAAYFCF